MNVDKIPEDFPYKDISKEELRKVLTKEELKKMNNDGFYVVCDGRNNREDDIKNQVMNIDIYFSRSYFGTLGRPKRLDLNFHKEGEKDE